MGLRKRLLFPAACSNRSGDSSADDKGFRTNAAYLDVVQQGAKRHRTPVSKAFARNDAEDWDSLVVSGPLREEVQVAAVSGFLSFGPFQILRGKKQHSREIISIALKKAKFRRT
jgi:hypothetical protein